MITIRLQRRGRKNDPSFRVIVVDSKKKSKTGNYLEMVGSYDPRQDRVELKGDRILEWVKNGATTSGTVHNLLVSNKIIDAKKINVLPLKRAPKKEMAPLVAETITEKAATEADDGQAQDEAPVDAEVAATGVTE